MKINLLNFTKIKKGTIKDNTKGGKACSLSINDTNILLELTGYCPEIINNRIMFYLDKKYITSFREFENYIREEFKYTNYEYNNILIEHSKSSVVLPLKIPLNIDKSVLNNCNYSNITEYLENSDLYIELEIKGVCYYNNKYSLVYDVKFIKILNQIIKNEEYDYSECFKEIEIIPDDV